MYAKSVAGLILRDWADNHIKERVNQSLTTDQRTTIKNELLQSPKVVTPIHPELIKHYLVFDIYVTEYGTALTTILPILFLYLNTVTVTAGTFEP